MHVSVFVDVFGLVLVTQSESGAGHYWTQSAMPWQRLSSDAGAHYARVPQLCHNICNNWCYWSPGALDMCGARLPNYIYLFGCV